MPAVYTAQYDLETGLWQILSRSGHVLYESADADYVRSVCRELCNQSLDRAATGAGAVPMDQGSCFA